jgi:2-hydroxy-6-oxonona-2,4-dienedioate hydrolase
LGIEKVAVVALSHGGPSALLFAVLHPERVSSLTLISCGVVSSVVKDQAEANKKGDMLTTIYQHDFLYWAITKVFKRLFMGLMGANKTVIAGLTPEQRDLVNDLIDYMNPVKPRAAGVTFDNKATMPNERIAAIRAPTLIFHAEDDSLQLYHNAEFAATTIPGAKLVSFGKGGHLLLIVEQSTIRTATQEFILEHIIE